MVELGFQEDAEAIEERLTWRGKNCTLDDSRRLFESAIHRYTSFATTEIMRGYDSSGVGGWFGQGTGKPLIKR
jgi:hypothetical protein